jgi:hypothetical protein
LQIFSFEYVFVLLAVLAYGIAGGFALVPFRRGLRFAALAAPLAGILCVTLGTAVFYGIVGLTAGHALAVSWGICVAATGASVAVCRMKLRWREIVGTCGVLVVTTVAVTRVVDVASIEAHGPALHFADATDQIGYAQAADWLRFHRVSDLPSATPENPFDAWLTVLFQIDPRFGSHFFLASVSSAKGVSGAFGFDPACAIALSAAVLGLAGMFGRSWGSLAMALAGLLLSHWYEDTRLGYLGKVLGYPGMLLVAGLSFETIELISLEKVVVAALVTAATAIVHSGAATALFLASICGIFLLARATFLRIDLRPVELKSTWHSALILAMLTGTAVMSSGIPSRPTLATTPHFDVNWQYLFPRVQDLEHQGANIVNTPNDHLPPLIVGREGKSITGFKTRTIRRLAVTSAVIWGIFLTIALIRKDPRAVGLFMGPGILLLIFGATGRTSEAFQLVGVIFPATVCGIARLMTLPVPPRPATAGRLAAIGVALAVAFIGLRGPRFVGSVRRYAGERRPRTQEFTLREIDKIVGQAGNEPVELRINSLQHLLMAMVELNTRGVHVQFTPSSYFSAFSYMGWSAPQFPPPTLILTLASDAPPLGWKVKLRAGQYVLLEPQ